MMTSLNTLRLMRHIVGYTTKSNFKARASSCRYLSDAAVRAQVLLDEIYAEVRAQRFEDIVVIDTKFNADPRYLILASAFNARHLISGTEMLNKHYKNAIKEVNQDFARVSVAKDWNVVDFNSVVVHLFAKDCRKHFDIEQLWSVGEKYDDLTNFPERKNSSPVASSSILSSRLGIPDSSGG